MALQTIKRNAAQSLANSIDDKIVSLTAKCDTDEQCEAVVAELQKRLAEKWLPKDRRMNGSRDGGMVAKRDATYTIRRNNNTEL